MMEMLMDNLYSNDGYSMAEELMNTQLAVLQQCDEEKIQNVAKSYTMLGDPLSPFRGGGWTPVSVEDMDASIDVQLDVHPNPSNSQAVIMLQVPRRQRIDIDIVDVRGRHVDHLFGQEAGPGDMRVTWAGIDDSGESCPSGVYFVVVKAVGGVNVQKMMLLK